MNEDIVRSQQTNILRLKDAWLQCEKHLYYLDHALSSLSMHLPVTSNTLLMQSDDEVQVWDQFILRFSKLQDTLGGRFYPALLDYLQEPTAVQPMLDKINRLEQLGLLTNASDWNALHIIRNQFSHDYPQDEEIKAAYLNQAIAAVSVFRLAMKNAKIFMQERNLT